MDYKDILINIMSLSDYHNKKLNTQYLVLEPTIIRIIDLKKLLSKEDLKNYIINFIQDTNTIEQIINYYTSNKLIIYNKTLNKYELSSYYNKELINAYNDLYNENSNKINNIEKFFINKIPKNTLKDRNILEYIHKFLSNIIIEDIDNDISNIDRNIALILNEISNYDNNVFLHIIRSLIKGMVILKAIKNNKNKKIFNNTNKVRIYLDNIFITNLFAWSEELYNKNSLSILDTLKKCGFELAVHSITIDLILEYAMAARSKNPNFIRRNSLFYHIRYPSYYDKNSLDVISCPIQSVKRKILETINDKYCIKIIQGFNYANKELNPKLYDKIHKDREKINKKTKNREDLADKQTLYDYTMVFTYKDIDIVKSNSLNNIRQIFLTYQRAITNNVLFKTYDLYTPIMKINRFMNLLLLESIINNVYNDSNLIDIVLESAYLKILSDSLNIFINNVYKEVNFTEDEKDKLLDLVRIHEAQSKIIQNDMNPKKVQKEIELEIAKQRNEINKHRKEIDSRNEEIIKQRKEIDSRNEEIIKQRKEIDSRDKEIINHKKKIDSRDEEIIKQRKEIDSRDKEISKQKNEINIKKKEIYIKNIIILAIIFFLFLIKIYPYLTNLSITISDNKIFNVIAKEKENILINVISGVIIGILTALYYGSLFIVKILFDKIKNFNKKKL